MKSYIKWIALGFFLTSCSSIRYTNTFGVPTLIHTDQYEVVQTKVKWTHTYPNGCPVIDFFEQFPEYDEIIDVTISEQVYEKKFTYLVFKRRSHCKFSGIGIKYKLSSQKDSISPSIKINALKSDTLPQEQSLDNTANENSTLDTTITDLDSSTQAPPELSAEENEKRIQEQHRIQNARLKYRDAMLKKKQSTENAEVLSTPISSSDIKRND